MKRKERIKRERERINGATRKSRGLILKKLREKEVQKKQRKRQMNNEKKETTKKQKE